MNEFDELEIRRQVAQARADKAVRTAHFLIKVAVLITVLNLLTIFWPR